MEDPPSVLDTMKYIASPVKDVYARRAVGVPPSTRPRMSATAAGMRTQQKRKIIDYGRSLAQPVGGSAHRWEKEKGSPTVESSHWKKRRLNEPRSPTGIYVPQLSPAAVSKSAPRPPPRPAPRPTPRPALKPKISKAVLHAPELRVHDEEQWKKARAQLEENKQLFEKYFKQGEALEKERVQAAKAAGMRSNYRPDTWTLCEMRQDHTAYSLPDEIGDWHLGLAIGDRFCSRTQMTTTGVHREHVRGIAVIEGSACDYASSVVNSDFKKRPDRHCRDGSVIYSAEGEPGTGQEKERRNKALMNNWKDRKPVRYFEKEDKHKTKAEFVYRGLYDVIDSRHENGNLVFHLIPRGKHPEASCNAGQRQQKPAC